MPNLTPLSGCFSLLKENGMAWRTVYVSDSKHMRLKLDNLFIEKNRENYIIPLNDISMVIVEGGSTVVTVRLLAAFARYNIVLIICDEKHLPVGIYLSYNQHFHAYKRLLWQMSWTQEQKNLMWNEIIKFKILNQREVLCFYEKDLEFSKLLLSYISDIHDGDISNREGHAAKVYFNGLFGQGFRRETQCETDAINAGMNYGYTIFRAQLARIICGFGLNPMLGIFHKNEYNSFNLVDDLIEPFRQIIDLWVYRNLKDSQYITFKNRQDIIALMSCKVIYDKQKMTVATAMEKYVGSFIEAMELGDYSNLTFPLASSLIYEVSDEV